MNRPVRVSLILGAMLVVAALVSACGTEKISVPKTDPSVHAGAVIFSQRCAGCHKFVKQDGDSPAMATELEALLKTLEREQPIEWVRVHRVPDHVFFTHKRHVNSGVSCRECHGEVEKMEVLRQVAPLSMGWCLDCHKRKQAERPAERARLTECVTCHK